jgi:transporter family protein
MWVLFAFGSALFAGITAILAKIGIKNTDSNLATAIRTIVILIFSWLMVFIVGSHKMIYQISGQTLIFLILSGLATGASWLCYFRALQLGDVNKVTPIDKSSTVLTMILAFIFLGENITWIKIFGICAIGIGTYMMIIKKTEEIKGVSDNTSLSYVAVSTLEEETKKVSDNRWLLYASLSAVFASLTSILGKIGIAGIESNLGTAIRNIVVLIMAWVVVFVSRKLGDIKLIDKKSWLFICLSGITTGASWLCYYKALQKGLASVVVPIDKLSIVISVAFSYFFLKEKLTRKSLLGLIIIVIGTLLLLIK